MASNSMKIGLAVVVGALAIGAAFKAGSSMVGPSKEPAAADQSTTTTAAPAAAQGDLVEFRDDKAGWAISYPKAWNRLEANSADIALVVSEKPAEQNAGGSILARVVTLGAPVDEANLAVAKANVIDPVVNRDGVRHITQPAVVHQAGLPGYFYFYSFKDPDSGRDGVHSHYFLFKGSTMISFVFQALPTGDFQRLANLFDEVIASFRIL